MRACDGLHEEVDRLREESNQRAKENARLREEKQSETVRANMYLDENKRLRAVLQEIAQQRGCCERCVALAADARLGGGQ